MDLVKLRSKLEIEVLRPPGHYTHDTIPDICRHLAMPDPGTEGDKKHRMKRALAAVPDEGLARTAESLLSFNQLHASDRNEIQDILWSDLPVPVVNKKIRRVVARSIDCRDLYGDAEQFDRLLDRLWVLEDRVEAVLAYWGDRTAFERSLRRMIDQYVHKNPGDWCTETLFEKLGAFDCSNKRFALFLEGLASAEVRPDEVSQRQFVAVVNEVLRASGSELRETDSKDGYPVFRLVSLHGSNAGRPKNLIFASSVKPDLRFRDAINNDVEIATNADKVLVYDRPIGTEGLTWDHLLTWWKELTDDADDERARKSLYARLIASLPEDSPPQRRLFECYLKRFGGAVAELPALVPEVWLHWDPKTVKERGPDALLRFRMDYLMLLPGGVRVVIEVDGQQHYADKKGRAQPAIYAKMAAADRELKLAGYHVYHFGAAELNDNEQAKAAAGRFFEDLFTHFWGSVPHAAKAR